MRICGVISSLGSGGAERVMTELCGAWAARGDEVTLLTLDDGATDFFMVPPLVTRCALGLASASSSAAGALRANTRRASVLREAIRRAAPDVVVSFTDRTNVLVLLATARLGVPVVVSERTDPRMHDPGRSWRALRRLVYPRADGLVVQTAAVAGWAERLLPPSRVHVIPNPLRHQSVAPHPMGDRAKRVVAMGRLVSYKGFDVLLAAFAATRRDCPDWALEVYGDGPDRATLMSYAATLGIADAVSFPGRTTGADGVLASTPIFVLSSRFEGFPNVLLEAMGAGCACVATDCPSGPRELLQHERSGLLVPVDDHRAMAAAMRDLMTNGTMRHAYGQAARLDSARFGVLQVLDRWDHAFAVAASAGTAAA